MKTNRQVTLAQRPQGMPGVGHFALRTAEMPTPGPGQMLLKTLYLSLDPYMRLRMNDGPSYAEPVGLGEPMCGGTVCRVETSDHPAFQPGDLVLSFSGWQEYSISDGEGVMPLPRGIPQASLALSVLGMPGFTAYYGLLHIGKPSAGETVVVSAATGGVGSVVGQIASSLGCRVIGVAGGETKCRYAVDELGFDACIDHGQADFAQALAAACPTGIDVYFENVGGQVLDAVIPLLNDFARLPLCGVIAWYNDDGRDVGDLTVPGLMKAMLVKRIKAEGFVILDHYEKHFRSFVKDMSAWLTEGRIKFREDLIDGLDNAPSAFVGLLQGENFGKVVVKVASQ